MKHLFLLFIFSVATSVCAAQTIQAVDGDTVLIDGEEAHLRGIDAPELDQPHGANAKSTIELMLKTGDFKVKDLSNRRGSKGRLVSLVTDNGTSMAETLVAIGLAWSTDPKGMLPTKMQKLMASAKRNKKLLWSESNPVNPAIWRQHPERYKADLTYLAENKYRAEQQRIAESAERQAAWNNLVATNPELAQQIIADREQKARDKKILRQLNRIRSDQSYNQMKTRQMIRGY